MSELTESTNVDNGKKENLENMIDENVGVCCIGFQKGPEMTILPAEPVEPDYVFQAILDELRIKSNENEVTIQLVIPKEYEKVKAQMKAKQAAQEKSLFGEEKSVSSKEDEQTK